MKDSQPHKVVIGRVYYIDAADPLDALNQAVERDQLGRPADVDALEVSVTVNPDDDD